MKSSFPAKLAESWLALNRLVTYHTLKWRLRKGARAAAYAPDSASMLYLAASALPYHTSGYTARTHEVIRALGAAGARVHVLTRPGYPWDRKDRQQDAGGDETTVDDVRYLHADRPFNNRPVLHYALQAAPAVAEVAARERVAVIHAASNHVNALPALLAARQLGIPFQYEMRGLWELTRISRMPGYEGSQAYKQGLQLEGLVARHADKLFVISEQLGNYAREHWGVDGHRMELLPNCVSPERFALADSREVEPQSIGYAGSLIGYEGLDTLIEAVDSLSKVGHPVRVHIIGDGEARAQLEAQVQRLGLANRIHFLGKMPSAAAREALARCAVVCIPRKPFKVCEIVPPIKLVEALAMGKPVIVPDLSVFRDEMGINPAGWFFRAGDAVDLAQAITVALGDQVALGVLGHRAREYATTQRRWYDFVTKAVPAAQGQG
jgi:glycosyltransferase involved in cell wall biosynthesis